MNTTIISLTFPTDSLLKLMSILNSTAKFQHIFKNSSQLGFYITNHMDIIVKVE